MLLRAPHAVIHPGRRLQNAAVRVTGGRIEAAGPAHSLTLRQGEEILDFDRCIILPGLVNAHTHLDLSIFDSLFPFDERPVSFVPWIKRIVEARYAGSLEEGAERARRGLEIGIAATIRAGVTAAGDFTQTVLSFDAMLKAGLRGVCFMEIIGLDPEGAEEKMRRAEEWVRESAEGLLVRKGIAPHAPYSARQEVYVRAAALARERGLPFSTHLSEAKEEIAWLLDRGGPIGEFLALRKAGPPGPAPGKRPVVLLDELGALRGLTAVHLNYLTDDEISRLARAGACGVFCPRSHAYFGHEAHPLPRLLAAGIPVALGTDSLCSNRTLSIVDEMAWVAREFPDLGAETVLRMATEYGHRALGTGMKGALAPGEPADVTIIDLEGRNVEDVAAWEGVEAAACLVAGKVLWKKAAAPEG
jgi:aminodeoxyfutalosine deaminase